MPLCNSMHHRSFPSILEEAKMSGAHIGKPVSIDTKAVSYCASLAPVCILSSVETMGALWFAECESLSAVPFEDDSRLKTARSRVEVARLDSLTS
jgi:hypothetical protein